MQSRLLTLHEIACLKPCSTSHQAVQGGLLLSLPVGALRIVRLGLRPGGFTRWVAAVDCTVDESPPAQGKQHGRIQTPTASLMQGHMYVHLSCAYTLAMARHVQQMLLASTSLH